MTAAPAMRRHLLGGTDAASLLGLGRESPLMLWMRLAGQIPDDFQGNDATDAGKLFEEHVAVPLVAKNYGLALRRPANIVLTLPDEPRIGVSLDFDIDGSRDLAEVKLTGSRAMWGAIGERVPLPVAAQAQFQMAVARRCERIVPCVHVFATFVPGFTMADFPVEEDRAVGDRLVQEARAMLQRVDTNNPPNPGDEADARALFLGRRGMAVQVGPDSEALLHAIARDKALIKEAEARVKAMRDSFIPMLGDATEVVDGKGDLLATYRPQRVFDEDRFRADHPDLWQQFTEPVLKMGALAKAHKKVAESYRREPRTSQESKRVLLLKIDEEN